MWSQRLNSILKIFRRLTVIFAAAAVCFVPLGASYGQTGARQADKAKAQAKLGDPSKWSELNAQTVELFNKGDYAGAETVARQALNEASAKFGENHTNTANSLNILAAILDKQGKYSDSEGLHRKALAIYEKAMGPDHSFTAISLNNLSLALEKLGKYGDAETLLRRAHKIYEKTLGPQHPDTAKILSNLARVLDSQGKYGTTLAQPQQQAKAPPAAAGAALAVKAQELLRQGQYEAAETLHHQVLATHEKTLGLEHPDTANSQSNLAHVLYLQGKYAEAEKLYRKALATREKVLGPDHADTATSLNNLANLLHVQTKYGETLAREGGWGRMAQQGKADDAETLYRRALNAQEKSLGPDHPATATTLNNLAVVLMSQGKNAEAEAFHRRVLPVREKLLGPEHPDTATTLTNLSAALEKQGKYSESEAAYLSAVNISRKAGNPRNLLLASSRLASSLVRRGRLKEALPYYRESLDTLDYLYAQTRGLSEETRQSFLGQYRHIYREAIQLLLKLYQQSPGAGHDREILAVASRNQSRIFTELLRQADVAKAYAGPAFTALKDKRDVLLGRIEELRHARASVPVSDANAEARKAELQQKIGQVEQELKSAQDTLWRDYPRFMELANPKPVTVEDLQARLLRPKEVLLSFVILPRETVIFAVAQGRFKMAVSSMGNQDILSRTRAIRKVMQRVAAGDPVLMLRQIGPDALHLLHRELIAPVEDILKGAEKVLVVADGALNTISLEFLVSRYGDAEKRAFESAWNASNGTPGKPYLGEWGTLEYVGKSYRFAYLPSLAALASQRLYPKPAGVIERELVAFADPVFSSDQQADSPTTTRSIVRAGSRAAPSGRSGAGMEIARLKETADEAREIASILGGTNRVFLREEAQEKAAKSAILKNTRYILFATHGFLGGDFLPQTETVDAPGLPRSGAKGSEGMNEPALVLTLVGDLQGEDGFLTMREVIEDLDLNAELVALSACNTAGETDQANNGEGFAGLTRAFMYAGAKSLLVSHWSVESLTTQALMTATFRNIKQGQKPLNALSNAQQQIIASTFNANNFEFSRAHPFFWAPFVYVGE